MKKYCIITPALILTLIMLSGCSLFNKQESGSEKNNQQSQIQEAEKNRINRMNENFIEQSIDDLEIGNNVLVMGVENDDGIITADRIIIGDGDSDFKEIFPMPMRTQGGQDSDGKDFQRPEGMPDFRNMSEEERAQFREWMMESGQMPARQGNGQRNLDQQMVHVQGEVIDNDDESITVKIDEGGSKFIFFSNEITILTKVKNI